MNGWFVDPETKMGDELQDMWAEHSKVLRMSAGLVPSTGGVYPFVAMYDSTEARQGKGTTKTERGQRPLTKVPTTLIRGLKKRGKA